MSAISWDELLGAVRAVVVRVGSALPSEDVDSIWALIDAGEPGVALENLCTQLYEYDVQVDPQTLADLDRVGRQMKLDPDLWSVLGS